MTDLNQHTRAAVYAALDLICEAFPACFQRYERRRRPLKIGIHADVLAALDGAIKPEELSAALGIYTKNKVYRSGLVAGAVRIDLNGQPCGAVTIEQAAPVPPRAPRAPRSKAAPPAPAIAPEVEAPAAPNGRLTLAGLRAAARARREAGSAS